MVRRLSFDKFYDHVDLGNLLHAWASERPKLLEVESIGKSWQGRDIHLATLTNRETGPHSDKPGFLVEANIHAAELTSSFAALHLIHTLLDGYLTDEKITRLLDTRTVYVVPRLNPDGAETVLHEGRYIRSSARPHPSSEPEKGLHWCDVDGDGRMLFMRRPDADGPWKRSSEDPRLLVRREPDEFGGEYFRLFIEGTVVGYDGVTVPSAEPYEGLDLGMNFQTDWVDMPERPRTAGPFSGSEPEIQAMMRAASDRPNITGYVTCHTFGALHLYPPMNDDEYVPGPDRRVFDEFGSKAVDLTGYTAMSYNDLKHEPYRVKGGQINWFYHEVGVFAWITEFWNPVRAAGLQPYHPSKWLIDHSEEDALRLLAWSDEQLAGNGFVDWYSFDHPQLGQVELGGWDIINYWYNPPLEYVEQEIAPHTDWVIFHTLAAPELSLRSLRSERIAPDTYRLELAIGNSGWLPTYVTQKALDRKLSDGVRIDVSIPDTCKLLSGATTTNLGHLEGRSQARTSTTWWGHDPGTPDLATIAWVIYAPQGGEVNVSASHPRAGRISVKEVIA